MQGFSILEYTARRGKKKTEASLLPFSFLLFELVDHVNVDVRYDCQNNEYKGKDRGYAAEDLVSGLALACAEKALGSTGNGAAATASAVIAIRKTPHLKRPFISLSCPAMRSSATEGPNGDVADS